LAQMGFSFYARSILYSGMKVHNQLRRGFHHVPHTRQDGAREENH
jgi:hypothetical protein